MDNLETLKNIEKSLIAILMLLVETRETALVNMDKKIARNIEVLLAEAGFNGPEIAKVVNKKLPAVQKAIQRGRKKVTHARK